MTPYTSTAPRWSKEDERREVEALSEEEKQQVNRDLFGISEESNDQLVVDNGKEEGLIDPCRFHGKGNCGSITTNPIASTSSTASSGEVAQEMEERLLSELAQVLHGLSQNDKTSVPTTRRQTSNPAAYLEATRLFPRLVSEEVPSLRFLQRENFDIISAVNRILHYWTLRKTLFLERAFSPMTLEKEDGALTDDDVAILHTGTIKFLPDDNRGRTVLFYHMGMSQPSQHAGGRDSLARCWFYMLTLAMQRENTTTNGLVLICNLKYYDVAHFDRRFYKAWIEMIQSCFPIKVVAIHFCYATTKSAFSLVLPMLQQLMGPYFRRRLVQHVGADGKILKTLNDDYGIQSVHESLGGNTVADRSWMDQNRLQEIAASGGTTYDTSRNDCDGSPTQRDKVAAIPQRQTSSRSYRQVSKFSSKPLVHGRGSK